MNIMLISLYVILQSGDYIVLNYTLNAVPVFHLWTSILLLMLSKNSNQSFKKMGRGLELTISGFITKNLFFQRLRPLCHRVFIQMLDFLINLFKCTAYFHVGLFICVCVCVCSYHLKRLSRNFSRDYIVASQEIIYVANP